MLDRLTDDATQAALIDVAHGEGVNARGAHIPALRFVHAAQSDDGDVEGSIFGANPPRWVSSRGPMPIEQASGMP